MIFILTWPLKTGEKVTLLKLLGPRFSFVLLKLLPEWFIISLIRCLESILLLHTSKPVFKNSLIKDYLEYFYVFPVWTKWNEIINWINSYLNIILSSLMYNMFILLLFVVYSCCIKVRVATLWVKKSFLSNLKLSWVSLSFFFKFLKIKELAAKLKISK